MRNVLGMLMAGMLCLAAGAQAATTTTLALAGGDAGAEPTVRVLAADGDILRLELVLPSLTVEELEVERERYQALSIPGAMIRGDDGQPGLPALSRLVQVPAGAAVRARVLAADRERFTGYRVLPVQPDEADGFVIDRDHYARGAADAPSLVEVGEPAVLRDLRVVPVTFNPVAYDPAAGAIDVARRVELELDFSTADAADAAAPPARPIPESFDRLYRDVVVNYRGDEAVSGPGTYLVICPNITSIITSLEPLLDWRRRQGYDVRLATTTETGSYTSSIKNYIQNIYDTADPPLEFVVLVGDANGTVAIPTFFESVSGCSGEGDHYYTTLAGGDYLADVHIGRLSVRTSGELDDVVDKIVTYEQNPPLSDADWFTRASLIGDPSTSGETCVYINQWLKQHLLAKGYSRVDTAWGGNFSSFFTSSVSQGCTVFGYRGYWHMSGISESYIANLSNGYELPFAVIITCDTGSFSDDTMCRSEAFLRNSNGGGIGSVGLATICTHTRENNVYYQGCWEGAVNGSDRRLGVSHTRGKLQMHIDFGAHSPNTAEAWSTWANLMGDPATDMWTAHPGTMAVTYPATVPAGASSLPVVVKVGGAPLAGARVALYQEGTLRVTGLTDGDGAANLPLAGASSGTVLVTVAKHDHVPFQGDLTLGSVAVYPSFAEATVDDDVFGDSDGNGDGVVNPGETIELPLALHNLGTATALGVTATLATGDPYATITDDTEDFGDIVGGATVWSAEDFDLVIGPFAPDGHVIDLDVMATTGLPTWTTLAQLTVVSAAFDYEDFTWSGGCSLDPGESGTLSVTVRNNGSIAAGGVTATLSCDSPWVTVSDPNGAYGTVGVGSAAENTGDPFGLSVSSFCFRGTPLNFTLVLDFNDGARDRVEFTLPAGTASADDPTGPDAYGYYCFDNTDTDYAYAPSYNWVEIAPNHGGSGTAVGLNDFGFEQDDTEVLDLPFPFQYYGVQFSKVSVCSNGWIAMGATNQKGCWNYEIPAAGGPDHMIAPFWDDLRQQSSDLVYYWFDETNHRFIVQWSRLRHQSTYQVQNFEVILHDPAHYPTPSGDGEIVFQYETVANTDNQTRYASTGIQNGDRTVGIGYTYWGSYAPGAATLTSGRAIRFLPLEVSDMGTLEGDVTNVSNGGTPIEGVAVRVISSGTVLYTGRQGHYQGSVPAGLFTVQAEHESFETVVVPGVSITIGETTYLDFEMTDIQAPRITNTTELPNTGDTTGPYVVQTNVRDWSDLDELELHYSVTGGLPTAVDMTLIDEQTSLYQAEIPGLAVNTHVSYWLTARDAAGNRAREPEEEGTFHEFWVLSGGVLYSDDFESDQGWTVGDAGDTATDGFWVREDPVGVWEQGVPVQPEDDASETGTLCFVTGNEETGEQGEDDVDGGLTTLSSPLFDLTDRVDVFVEYQRWYSNDTGYAPGTDNWQVRVTDDDGASWHIIDFTTESTHAWYGVSIPLDAIIDMTDQVRFQFIASDYDPDSVVEAAVDDFRLIGFYSPTMTPAPGTEAPAAVTLLGAVPNPFNPSTEIRFGLPEDGPVTLRVFDVGGRLVRTLAAERPYAAGVHAVRWDGLDEAGRPASSGVYLYALEAADARLTGKAVLLK